MFHPQKLKIKGFLSFGSEEAEELDLSKITFATITGQNGEGKTTIFNALVWAIYGDTRTSDVDSVVNYGSDKAEVTLEFMTDGAITGRIHRTRTYGKSSNLTVQFYDEDSGEWKDQTDHTIKGTQQMINTLIGMDSDIFHSLVYLDQDSNGENLFVRSTSPLRRAILMSLIPDEGRWSEYEAAIRAQVASIKSTLKTEKVLLESRRDQIEQAHTDMDDAQESLDVIGALEMLEKRSADIGREIEDIEDSLDGKSNIAQLRSSLAAKRSRREETIRMNSMARNQITGKLEEHAELTKEKAGVITRYETLNEELADLQARCDQLDIDMSDAEEQCVKIVPAVEQADANVQARQEKISTTKANIAMLTERRSKLTNPCMICESEMTEDRLHTVQHEADDELAKLAEKLNDLWESLTKAKNTQKNARKRADDADAQVIRIRKELNQSEARIDAIGGLMDDLEERNSRLKAKINSIPVDSLQGQLEAIVDPVADDEESHLISEIAAEEDKDQSAHRIAQLERERRTVNSSIAQYKEAKSDLRNAAKQLTAHEDEEAKIIGRIEGYEDALFDLEILVVGCSPKGAPSILIESVLNEIKTKQDESLSKLTTDGKIVGVDFTQSREKKGAKGGTRAELDILTHFADGSVRRVESLSDGERVRVAVSNLIAMIEVFNAIHPGLVSWVMMDEPFVHLDDSVIPVVMNLIHDALDRKVVQMMMITSHQEKVIASANQRIHVALGRDGNPHIEIKS